MRGFAGSMAAALAALTWAAACGPMAPTGGLTTDGPVLRAAAMSATSTERAAAAGIGAAPAPEATGSAADLTPATVAQRLLDEPGRRIVKFSNGITALLHQNRTAAVVAVQIHVKAGSTTEGPHTGAGISHVLEHLVASAATAKRPQEENTRLLLQIGNDSNAYTYADFSFYFINAPKEQWPLAMELLTDITAHSAFTKAQFDREYKVVQRELEMREAQADNVFHDLTLQTRYLESPARYPVVGTKAAFQNLTLEDCTAYYRRMYVPDNLIVSVAGDIDLDAAETTVLNQIKGLRRRPAPVVVLPPEPPVTAPRRSVSRGDVTQARIEWAFPTTDIYGADVCATDILAGVLGGGESSLLVRRLRDELLLATDIACANPTPRHVAGQLEIAATLPPEKIPAAQEAMLAVIEDVAAKGVPDAAVTRAKAQLAATMTLDFQTGPQQALRNARDYLISGTIDFSAEYLKRLQAVTPGEVQSAARKYLRRDRMLTTLLLPRGAKDPFAAGASAMPAAAPVTVRKTVLPNGVTLLVSRNTAAPLACFNLYALGGLLAEDDATNGLGTVMMNLMARETTTRSHAQIADFLDLTGTSVVGTSGNSVFQLSMACMKQHAPDAFALFADMALHPKFSADELSQVRHAVIGAADTATEDWSGEALATMRQEFYASSPYKRMPEGDRSVVDTLTTSQIAQHYRSFFLNPARMVLAISGDIDPDAALRWAEPFGTIAPRNPALNTFSVIAEPRHVVRPSDRDSATVMVAYPGAAINSPDRHALILLKTLLGGYSSPSGSILHESLRGRGLVYTVRTANIMGPAGGMFLVTALGEPRNADAIAGAIATLIAGVREGKITDAQFRAAQEQAIAGEKLSRLTVADISSQEALDELFGLGFDDRQNFAQRINAVTRASFLKAAEKYLAEPTVVILSPTAN